MNGITVTGWDEMIEYISKIEISDQLEKKALTEGGKVFFEAIKEATPELTGDMKKSWKKGFKKATGGKAYRVYSNQWDIVFADSGSSKNKAYVNFTQRAVESKIQEVAEAITNIVKGAVE